MPFHKLNEENLKIYLRNVLNYNTDVLKIEKFGVGQSNPTYHVYCGGREFVLRKKPPGKLLKGAHQVRREFKVISSLSKVGFCVPHPIAFCSDQNVLGTDFYLMEYVKGRVFYSNVPDMTKDSAREMIMSCICTLAKLHSYRPENIGLADYGKPDGYLKRQLATWSRQYKASAPVAIPSMEKIMLWLEQNLPQEGAGETSIVHGDYTLGNIMFWPDKFDVHVVLDWELSTLGHPLLDVAYFCMSVYHVPPRTFGQGDEIIKLRQVLPPEDEVVREYCKQREWEYPPEDYDFCMALSFFKLASIVQGIVARFKQGNASNVSAGEFEDFVTALAKKGYSYATRNNKQRLKMEKAR